MSKTSLILSAVLLTAGVALATAHHVDALGQDAPTPAEAKNPVKWSPEIKAKGKKLYTTECEMCHAASGDGKTDLAKDMKMTLTDLADPKTLDGRSDAQLYDLVKNGKGQMPPEGDRMKKDDIWTLVLYLRSLSKPQ